MQLDPRAMTPQDVYKLLTGTVVPRPIGWISTISRDGIPNAAPFSFFNVVGNAPPMVVFSAGMAGPGVPKDTLRNVRDTGEFVVNIVTEATAAAMNITATDFPPQVNEFEAAGLTAAASVKVKAPRIAESPVNFECELVQIIPVGQDAYHLVLGEIVQMHVADGLLENGRVRIDRLKPVGRLAGNSYCRVNDVFELVRQVYQGSRA